MKSWLVFVCWGTGCTVNYFMDIILDHSYLCIVSCFHHSWLYVRADVSVFRGGAVCWLLLCRSTCFLAFGHWIRKQWWSLSAAVVDSCNWSSTRDIYNPSDTKTSPNVIHNKEIRPHSRSWLSQNNCFCNKSLKIQWRANQKKLAIDYDWLEVISYTGLFITPSTVSSFW